MKISHVRTESLGDSTYLVTHENTGIVVDPQRDIDRFERLIDESGVELRFVLETHLHNTYISGGPELARRTGAELVLRASAAPAYRHCPRVGLDQRQEVWVACESGYRANLAASVLELRGFRPVVLDGSGVPEVLKSLAGSRGSTPPSATIWADG